MGKLVRWFFPTLEPQEQERRLGLFRALLLVQVGTAVLAVATSVMDVVGSPLYALYLVGVCLGPTLLAALGYILARRGTFHLGAYLLVVALLIFPLFFLVFYGTRGPISYLYVWPIMMAAILLEAAPLFLSTTLAALAFVALAILELYQVWPIPLYHNELYSIWHQTANPFIVQTYVADLATVVLAYYAVAFFSWIAARSLRRAVARSREQAAELERYGVELEGRVAERTAELSQTLSRLQGSLEVIQQVSCPVLPILEHVILTPLVGTLDSERAQYVMDRVLRGVAQERARVAILDVTGVAMVDTIVANALLQAAQGIRLLGATPVLVGIRAEVAQTMVELGVDLAGIVTRSSLQEGLEYARTVVEAQGSVLEQAGPAGPAAVHEQVKR